MKNLKTFEEFVNESSTNEAEMTISGLVYHQWNDKQAQRKLNKVKIKIVSDLENVLTISGEEKELDKVRDIFAIKESVINEAASVPSNIMDFTKRKGSYATALVKKAATWAEKAGKRISGGTAIGKNYSTIILDMKHQGSEIYINLDKETIKLFGEEVTDAKSFQKVLDANK